jgi:hypothetical protein
MSNLIRVGKRFIPVEHVALVEPYVPTPASPLRTSREFKSRIVLLNRDSVLSESAPEEIAEKHAFRVLPSDAVATNPAIRFGVEAFEPAENFTPSKNFMTRLSWHDLDGNSQSKLLLTAPEVALAIAVRGERPEGAAEAKAESERPRRKRGAAARTAPKHEAV